MQQLLKVYDPDRNGLDLEEFTEMLQEICEVNFRFTGFEKLEQLSMTQLHALKAHDWSLPVKDHIAHDDKFEEEHFTLRPASTPAEPEAVPKEFVRTRDMIASVADEGLSREELLEWVQEQMLELVRTGKLTHPGIAWSGSANEKEQQAIARLGFIFLTYHAHAWWFEIVVMVQKLFLTSAIIFVSPSNKVIQLGAAFFASFFFLVLVMWYRPLANSRLHAVQVFSLICTCLTLSLGIMTKTPDAFSQVLGPKTSGDGFAVIPLPI